MQLACIFHSSPRSEKMLCDDSEETWVDQNTQLVPRSPDVEANEPDGSPAWVKTPEFSFILTTDQTAASYWHAVVAAGFYLAEVSKDTQDEITSSEGDGESSGGDSSSTDISQGESARRKEAMSLEPSDLVPADSQAWVSPEDAEEHLRDCMWGNQWFCAALADAQWFDDDDSVVQDPVVLQMARVPRHNRDGSMRGTVSDGAFKMFVEFHPHLQHLFEGGTPYLRQYSVFVVMEWKAVRRAAHYAVTIIEVKLIGTNWRIISFMRHQALLFAYRTSLRYEVVQLRRSKRMGVRERPYNAADWIPCESNPKLPARQGRSSYLVTTSEGERTVHVFGEPLRLSSDSQGLRPTLCAGSRQGIRVSLLIPFAAHPARANSVPQDTIYDGCCMSEIGDLLFGRQAVEIKSSWQDPAQLAQDRIPVIHDLR
ncbi:hypothetical protein BKA62DRAFT_810075 [Auriculariales sp. MPI-PUGE-AT-0066]|nr:hypothetical protein BKA62DRAFT_810075 [Auriculariales sp. MPI-PUGE-AT-0066]